MSIEMKAFEIPAPKVVALSAKAYQIAKAIEGRGINVAPYFPDFSNRRPLWSASATDPVAVIEFGEDLGAFMELATVSGQPPVIIYLKDDERNEKAHLIYFREGVAHLCSV